MFNKKVLVTGAGGYVGSVLVQKLLSLNYQVLALDRFFFGKDKLPTHSRLTCIQEDTRFIKKQYFSKVDYVIDLAAISNDPSGEVFHDETWAINLNARWSTAKAAKEMGVSKYLLASSCSVYGDYIGVAHENVMLNPLTTYAKANAMAEEKVLSLSRDEFSVVVIRQPTLFGLSPRMRFDLAINIMTYSAWKDKCLKVIGNGEQYRPFLNVIDTADAMCVLLEADHKKIEGEIFNVGSDHLNFQMKTVGNEIALAVSALMNEDVAVKYESSNDKRSYQISCKKFTETFNWQPKNGISCGVGEIILALESSQIRNTDETSTLSWYKLLTEWHYRINDITMHKGILSIGEK